MNETLYYHVLLLRFRLNHSLHLKPLSNSVSEVVSNSD